MAEIQTSSWRIAQQPAERAKVAVIGAGVMGAGIAQVAAQAGHPVALMDVRDGAAQAAVAQIAKGLAGLVDKGRMTVQQRDALLERISPASQMSELADAALVIEVIVERLEPKRELLQALDALLPPDALIASNTSSISITALANGMTTPGRLVGMHFFNPVPQMKLVEVVSGAETLPDVAHAIEALARLWGKTPVHARSTPGFIVNRIARPYYAESLSLLQEQAGTPAQLDRALRGAGFRMGPCELMDLIGHDTNFLVTQSVFNANYGDRRYVPSLVQQALVDGGRLGRKVGKGFYGAALVEAGAAEPVAACLEGLPPVSLVGQGPLLDGLGRWLTHKGVDFTRHEAAAAVGGAHWTGLLVGGVRVPLTCGRTAAQWAHESGHADWVVMDWPVAPDRVEALAVACAPQLSVPGRAQMAALWQALGWVPLHLRDVPGLVVARTVAMLVNEGADAVWQGVCDAAGADLAMKLGVNYPAGPFEWLTQLGPAPIVQLLERLFETYRSERYRISPLIQMRRWGAA